MYPGNNDLLAGIDEVVDDDQSPTGRIIATTSSGRGRPVSIASEVAADPRHVFLSAREVMNRYGWGQTRGYQNLKDRDLVPEPVMKRPNRWRLDQLLAHEDRRIAQTQKRASTSTETVHDARTETHTQIASLLPQPKRRRSA